MPLRQQTLFGETLSYNPTPSCSSSLSRVDPPVCKFSVVFEPVSGGVTSETVYIQDCTRDGRSAPERAYLAAAQQTPFEIGLHLSTDRQEETTKSIDGSDEWRVDDLIEGSLQS